VATQPIVVFLCLVVAVVAVVVVVVVVVVSTFYLSSAVKICRTTLAITLATSLKRHPRDPDQPEPEAPPPRGGSELDLARKKYSTSWRVDVDVVVVVVASGEVFSPFFTLFAGSHPELSGCTTARCCS